MSADQTGTNSSTSRDLEGRAYQTGQRYDWHTAYAKWLPDALAENCTEANDAFRAGYLAAVKDMMEIQNGR